MHCLRAPVIDHYSKLGQVQPTLVGLLLLYRHCTAACGMLVAEPLPLDQQTTVIWMSLETVCYEKETWCLTPTEEHSLTEPFWTGRGREYLDIRDKKS